MYRGNVEEAELQLGSMDEGLLSLKASCFSGNARPVNLRLTIPKSNKAGL
jgi:hypothetical protein